MNFVKRIMKDDTKVIGIKIINFMCLDGKEREIHMNKDVHGAFHFTFTTYKNGELFGASHGTYKPNKKIFGDNFEAEAINLYNENVEL